MRKPSPSPKSLRELSPRQLAAVKGAAGDTPPVAHGGDPGGSNIGRPA